MTQEPRFRALRRARVVARRAVCGTGIAALAAVLPGALPAQTVRGVLLLRAL